MKKNFDIYVTGVGGQGIGLLCEALLRAADLAGLPVKAVDTHGLAQRGGIVISHVRIGESAHSPLIAEGKADLVVALERTEALRAMNVALKDGGTLVYYDTVLQPLPVRLGKAAAVTRELITRECLRRGISEVAAFRDDLKDSRMQNMVLLAVIARDGLIPGVNREHYQRALDDLLEGKVLEMNLELFNSPAAEALP
ncbi:MAG: 2-oxoacid:acceptor oxidoreductase family protein [Candidatus Eremiobacteraeota bacterium]|nr:2-oxoacid:acceptor oxidoreductase family protein [Candidatus Eremiobacteraeota bacterium]